MSESSWIRRHLTTIIVVAAIIAIALPPVVFAYLPMTDLPQHVAIVSILEHLHDPSYGFDAWYEAAYDRTLYLLPYLMAYGLTPLMSAKAAMSVVVAIALASYPIGAWLLLRATGKPAYLVLLTIPFVYNRIVFWGFINMMLAMGLALAALSIVISERKSWRSDVVLALLGTALVTTHLYGVLFFGGYLALWMITGDRAPIFARWRALIPPVVGTVIWTLVTAQADVYSENTYVHPLEKLKHFHDNILGGYTDPSELVVLGLFIVAFVVVSWDQLPITWERWFELSRQDKLVWMFAGANVLLYFAAPEGVASAKVIYIRHAMIAASLLPLAANASGIKRWRKAAFGLLGAVSLAAIVNTWVHLARFDAEASSFDEVIAAVPQRPRMVGLIYGRDGQVMRTAPYLHFESYIQAEKGGLQATSFPAMFWNIPVKATGLFPTIPQDFEWTPQRFGEVYMFFDYVIVRGGDVEFPLSYRFDLVAKSGSWRVYRKLPPGARSR